MKRAFPPAVCFIYIRQTKAAQAGFGVYSHKPISGQYSNSPNIDNIGCLRYIKKTIP